MTRMPTRRSLSASGRSSKAAYVLANSVSPPVSATAFAVSTVAICGHSSPSGLQPSMCQKKVPLR